MASWFAIRTLDAGEGVKVVLMEPAGETLPWLVFLAIPILAPVILVSIVI